MDVCIFFLTACLLAVSSGQEPSQPTEATAPPASTPAQIDGNTTDTSNSGSYDKPTIYCLTGFGEDGVCTDRQFCVYGTAAIDKTLYARHGYVSPCPNSKEDPEVCCPRRFVTKPPLSDDLDF